MLSLWLTSYGMELGFNDLFISYELELETHGHVDIENQLGLTSYEMELGYCRV